MRELGRKRIDDHWKPSPAFFLGVDVVTVTSGLLQRLGDCKKEIWHKRKFFHVLSTNRT
jgi:hypothetical protein